MAIAFDGTQVPDRLSTQNCGGTPIFDCSAGYGYRCDLCYAIIGSIGQSDKCKELNDNNSSKQSDYEP